MLIKFNFKNFKSFKNENCLDMEAASIKEHEYNTIDIKDKKLYKRTSYKWTNKVKKNQWKNTSNKKIYSYFEAIKWIV